MLEGRRRLRFKAKVVHDAVAHGLPDRAGSVDVLRPIRCLVATPEQGPCKFDATTRASRKGHPIECHGYATARAIERSVASHRAGPRHCFGSGDRRRRSSGYGVRTGLPIMASQVVGFRQLTGHQTAAGHLRGEQKIESVQAGAPARASPADGFAAALLSPRTE